MPSEMYSYQPKCSVVGCERPAVYKIATAWSLGNFSELKNYGLCCEEHRQELHTRALSKHKEVRPAKEEAFGDVKIYRFVRGGRDADLVPIDSA